jgi:hypothetical protein
MWPPENAISIRLRIGDAHGTSWVTEKSARELVIRLRALQTAMGSAQLVAGEIEGNINRKPGDRPTLALFGEQANTIIAAIDEWDQDEPLPDDAAALRTALESTS